MNGQAGKGDKSRITDLKAYKANFAEIDWGTKCKPVYEMGFDRVVRELKLKKIDWEDNRSRLLRILNEEAQRPSLKRMKIAKLFSKKPWPDPMTQ